MAQVAAADLYDAALAEWLNLRRASAVEGKCRQGLRGRGRVSNLLYDYSSLDGAPAKARVQDLPQQVP